MKDGATNELQKHKVNFHEFLVAKVVESHEFLVAKDQGNDLTFPAEVPNEFLVAKDQGNDDLTLPRGSPQRVPGVRDVVRGVPHEGPGQRRSHIPRGTPQQVPGVRDVVRCGGTTNEPSEE